MKTKLFTLAGIFLCSCILFGACGKGTTEKPENSEDPNPSQAVENTTNTKPDWEKIGYEGKEITDDEFSKAESGNGLVYLSYQYRGIEPTNAFCFDVTSKGESLSKGRFSLMQVLGGAITSWLYSDMVTDSYDDLYITEKIVDREYRELDENEHPVRGWDTEMYVYADREDGKVDFYYFNPDRNIVHGIGEEKDYLNSKVKIDSISTEPLEELEFMHIYALSLKYMNALMSWNEMSGQIHNIFIYMDDLGSEVSIDLELEGFGPEKKELYWESDSQIITDFLNKVYQATGGTESVINSYIAYNSVGYDYASMKKITMNVLVTGRHNLKYAYTFYADDKGNLYKPRTNIYISQFLGLSGCGCIVDLVLIQKTSEPITFEY